MKSVTNIINNVKGVNNLVMIWSHRIEERWHVGNGSGVVGFGNRTFFLYSYIWYKS